MPDEAIIRLENLEKTLEGRQILRGLSLEIRRGETMVIIGRSGVGKSVTLKHIVGLMRPDRGRVIIDGVDLSTMRPAEMARFRKKFGLLFQSGALINWLTVGENVALPLIEHERLPPARIRQIVREKLALVDMLHAEHLYPSDISGGMKKRAGLARAIVRDPEVVLYDEPTSGLDPVMSNQINELILDMQRRIQVTSLVVTHDMESAYMIADRIAMLYNGGIVQACTPAEMQASHDLTIRQFIEGDTTGPITDAIRGEEGAARPTTTPTGNDGTSWEPIRALRLRRRSLAARPEEQVSPAPPPLPRPEEKDASPVTGPDHPVETEEETARTTDRLREEIVRLKQRLAETELSKEGTESEVERRLNESILRDLGG